MTITIKSSPAYKKWRAVLRSGVIAENEIIALRKALNGYSSTSLSPDEKNDILERLWDKPLNITPDQTRKGLAWLMDQWKTPRGIERKNNPFGYREQDILQNFKKFQLTGLQDCSTYTANQMGFHNYLPLYKVIAKDGSTFEYIGKAGEVEIIG